MAVAATSSEAVEILTAPQHFTELYRDKVILAPMVRVGTLPFRLLAIDMGADLVYSEETIDWKILRCNRRYNESFGTTEFYDRCDGTVFLRTCDRERSKLIVQIGTSDAQRALKVAKQLEPYVAGIDVNCGCPKEFSIKGGMGAALLTQPDKIRNILTTLVKGLSVPVTCKIRILPDLDDTLKLCRLIENCGVAALAVHGRTKTERTQHANHNSVIREIASVVKIPVIANGGSKEIHSFGDIKGFCDRTQTSSVMIARAAMWNCSIMRADGILPLDDMIKTYLKYCIQYDNPFTYTKYTVQNMLRDLQASPRGKAFLETQTLREIALIWDLGKEYDKALALQQEKNATQSEAIEDMLDQRRWAYQSRDEIEVIKRFDQETGKLNQVAMPMQFIRGNFIDADLPKMVLNRYANQHTLDPVFGADCRDRYFIGKVEVDGVSYITSCIEKSRRYAEQAAAMVYLHAQEAVEHDYGLVAASGTRRYQHLSQLAEKMPKSERQLQHALKSHLGRNRRRQKNPKAYVLTATEAISVVNTDEKDCSSICEGNENNTVKKVMDDLSKGAETNTAENESKDLCGRTVNIAENLSKGTDVSNEKQPTAVASIGTCNNAEGNVLAVKVSYIQENIDTQSKNIILNIEDKTTNKCSIKRDKRECDSNESLAEDKNKVFIQSVDDESLSDNAIELNTSAQVVRIN